MTLDKVDKIQNKLKKRIQEEGNLPDITEDMLQQIEEMSYLGITDVERQSALLRLKTATFSKLLISDDRILIAISAGQARAYKDAASSVMRICRGDAGKRDMTTFTAARYVLQSRFDYDENAAQSKIKIEQFKKRYDLDLKRLESSLDAMDAVKIWEQA